MTLDPRKKHILNAIICQFVDTAQPVGSQAIIANYYLKVSSATIRNEMSDLEKEGLIYQPHTSAGRVPTRLGYKVYIDNFSDTGQVEQLARLTLEKAKKEYHLNKAQEKIYDLVSILANITPNIVFATIPGRKRAFYLGVSNILKQPEFAASPLQASQVMEILEEKEHFIAALEKLGIDESIKIFIGEENLIREIESCSIIATEYEYQDFKGYMGILGPTRMNYPFNSAILKEAKKILLN